MKTINFVSLDTLREREREVKESLKSLNLLK